MDEKYRQQIEDQYKIALDNLKKLSPAPNIDERLSNYAGCMKAIMELKRIALGQPILWCSSTNPSR